MKQSKIATSWRAEFSALISLAAPVILVQLGLMSFGVVDTMMLGHYSDDALAAAGIGHLYAMMILLAGFGLLLGLDPLVSQAWGAGRVGAVAAHFKRGLWMSAWLTIVATVAMYAAEPALRLLNQKEELIGPATSYIKIVAFGNIGFLTTIVLRQTLQAMSIVAPLVLATLVGNVFNILGNWALIWGKFGFPEMGLEGSATTTACSRVLLVVVFAFFSRKHWLPLIQNKDEDTSKRGYKALLAIGIPLSAQLSLEAGVFNAVGFIMGQKGVTQVAGNQVTLNVASLVFMIPMGIGAAVSTRVGNAIGAGDQERASRAARLALSLGAGFMLCSGILFLSIPDWVAGLYTSDATVVACAATLIPVAGWFSIFDGLQCVAHGILRGMADTTVPAILSLIAFWVIGLPVGIYLDDDSRLGPPGLWWGLVIGLGLMAVTLGVRIVQRFKTGIEAYE